MIRKLRPLHPLARIPGPRLWLAVLACLPALNLAACKEKTPPAAAAQQQSAATPVGVAKVERRPITQGTNFIGRIEAVRSVDLIARVNGFLRQQNYKDGQEVKAGDLLFVIEKETYEAAVDAAKANLAQARANAANATIQANRARALLRTRDIPTATLDERIAAEKQWQASIAQAQANLEQAQINLGYTEIRAPFAGRVGRARFKTGALVGPNTGPLASIVSQDPVYATFPVADRILLNFRARSQESAKLGQSVLVRLMLSNGQEYPHPGTIDFTDIRVDQTTDTVTVRALVPNPDRLLVDGQFVRVLAEERQPVMALLVPQRALVTDQSGTSVFVVGPDRKAVQRPIKAGNTVGTDLVVQDGLKEGELVVVDGIQQLRPGATVDPHPVADSNTGQSVIGSDEASPTTARAARS